MKNFGINSKNFGIKTVYPIREQFLIKQVQNMNKVIDFLQIKEQKQTATLEKVFQKANTLNQPELIDKLVEGKELAVQDHKMFLAFLTYLEEKQIEPATIFNAVLTLPKHQFEAQYGMNWQSVVQLCFTFLTILKESDPIQYEQFISRDQI